MTNSPNTRDFKPGDKIYIPPNSGVVYAPGFGVVTSVDHYTVEATMTLYYDYVTPTYNLECAYTYIKYLNKVAQQLCLNDL